MTTATRSGAAVGGDTPPPAAAAPRRRRRGDVRVALAFLAPSLVLLVMLRLLPSGAAVVDSFRTGSLRADGGSWAGLANYRFLLGDAAFWDTVLVTARFLVVIVPVQIVCALVLALVLAERVHGVGIVRVLIFLPVAAPGAVATVVWGVALQPSGSINAVLGGLGIDPQPFLTSPDQALWSIVLLLSWVGVGYWTLFLLAGLQDVPRELYEAAAIDGAGWWRCLWSVTLPNLRRPLAFVVVGNTVASVLTFVPVQVLTRGGPAGSTRLYLYDLYTTAFTLGDINLAQAQVVLLLLLLIAVTAVQFRLLSRER